MLMGEFTKVKEAGEADERWEALFGDFTVAVSYWSKTEDWDFEVHQGTSVHVLDGDWMYYEDSIPSREEAQKAGVERLRQILQKAMSDLPRPNPHCGTCGAEGMGSRMWMGNSAYIEDPDRIGFDTQGRCMTCGTL